VADPRRPDPSKGVFETLLVLDGRPVELDAHLARLGASVGELFPGLAAPNLEQVDVPMESGAMRIDIVPRDDCLEAEVSFREVGQQSGTTALRSLSLAGGLGPHKWRDRSLLDRAQAQLKALPLIVDVDGSVLEAVRANVFAVRDETLFTPRTDGRILPGITRARVLEIANAIDIDSQEEPLTHDDLLFADDVFLTGSVRGIEHVASLDGSPRRNNSEIVDRLSAELQLAWTGAKTVL
jgi:para-aminobenzoate synthetase/4-amino-4-deoxychorismate lyase